MAVDFKSEKDVKLYVDNLGIEYRFGCFSEKNPQTCHLLGDFLEAIKKDYEKAAKIYRSNCDDYSFYKSCHKYAGYKYTGRGIPKNLEDALKYFEKGCNGGIFESCLNGGLMCVSNSDHQKTFPKDYDKGMKLLSKACDNSIAYGCYYLAGIYIRGNESLVEKDMKKAFEYSKKGCDLGHMYSCFNISQMYKNGEGVEKDLKKSEEYKEKTKVLKEKESGSPIEFQQGT